MKKGLLRIIALCVFTLLPLLPLKAQDVVIIVNNANPINIMMPVEVKLYYMRNVKQEWPQINEKILPVGLTYDSRAKSAFLNGIMRMSSAQLDAYYQQRAFSNGDPMPPHYASEADVIAYVINNKGALGYVSTATYEAVSSRVKAVYSK